MMVTVVKHYDAANSELMWLSMGRGMHNLSTIPRELGHYKSECTVILKLLVLI